MLKKTAIFLSLMFAMTGLTYAQSLKSNSTTLSFKIPGKQEWPFKNYEAKLTSDVFLLTSFEEDEVPGDVAVRPSNIAAANEEKKAALTRQYLTFFSKTIGHRSDEKPDLLVEVVTTDFVFKDLSKDISAANPEDVIARIEGSAQLKVTDINNGTEVFRRDIPIPAEDAVITKAKMLTLNPGLSIQLKFVKKSNTEAIAAMLNRGLQDTKIHYMHNCLTRAGYMVKGLFEDQKGYFNLPVYYARGKMDYAELEQTSEAFKSMLEALGKDRTISAIKSSAANDVIIKSIAVWEKEVTQASPDKEARINSEIARGLNLNLASAYVLIGEWEKASHALSSTGFIIAEGTELGGTGSAKEYFIDIRRTFFMASAAPEQIAFTN